MKNWIWSLLLFASTASAGLNMELVRERCGPAPASETFFYSNNFSWGQPFAEMADLYQRMYNSEKRYHRRAYFDATTEQLLLPYDQRPIRLDANTVYSIQRHIEEALRLKYADFIFFSDMGHNHIHIPQALWDNEISLIRDHADRYEVLFNHPEIKYLYHTAEQMKFRASRESELLPDPHVRWRFFTRNVVGDNRGEGRTELLFNPESRANTARGEPGHRYWGAGLSFQATQNGCFPFTHNGQTYYFDISMHDLPYQGLPGGM